MDTEYTELIAAFLRGWISFELSAVLALMLFGVSFHAHYVTLFLIFGYFAVVLVWLSVESADYWIGYALHKLIRKASYAR